MSDDTVTPIDTTVLRPYQFDGYGRNTVVIQREERGFLTVNTGRDASSQCMHARWSVMVAALAGEPVPAPPDLPGRVHRAPRVTDADPHAEAWDARPKSSIRSVKWRLRP
jgi:hypothetical protein